MTVFYIEFWSPRGSTGLLCARSNAEHPNRALLPKYQHLCQVGYHDYPIGLVLVTLQIIVIFGHHAAAQGCCAHLPFKAKNSICQQTPFYLQKYETFLHPYS